jgi:hypothetical protein
MTSCLTKDVAHLERIARQNVSDRGEKYKAYHEQFKKKSLCAKLLAIAFAAPGYLYYTYLAGDNERYTYRALCAYLKRIQ